MAASAVFHGDGIDVVLAGADFAEDAALGFGEIHPGVNAADLAHDVDHAAGDGEITHPVALGLGAVGVDVGHAAGGGLNLQHEFGAQLDKGEVVGVEVAEDIRRVKAPLHEEGGHLKGLCVGGIVAETPRIRDHTRVQQLGGHGGNGEFTFLGEGCHKSAAALKGCVGDLHLANGLHEDVVIHTGGVRGGGIPLVADEGLAGGVQHNGQGVGVRLVSHLVQGLVYHEGVAVGHVTHGQDILVGEGILQDVAQTQLAAQGIAVGILVTVNDDAGSLTDQLQKLFKHRYGYPFTRQNIPCISLAGGCSGRDTRAAR